MKNGEAEAEDVMILVLVPKKRGLLQGRLVIMVEDIFPKWRWGKDEWLVQGWIESEAFV